MTLIFPEEVLKSVEQTIITRQLNIHFFKKDFIYFLRGREGERERNITVWLPLTWPPLGAWPATQTCALTGNRTSDPLDHSPHSIHWAIPARSQYTFLCAQILLPRMELMHLSIQCSVLLPTLCKSTWWHFSDMIPSWTLTISYRASEMTPCFPWAVTCSVFTFLNVGCISHRWSRLYCLPIWVLLCGLFSLWLCICPSGR